MKYHDTRLLVFAKAPEPGKVKTRLIPLLGEEGACHLYRQMVDHCIKRAWKAQLCAVEIWCSPNATHPYFMQCAKECGLPLFVQEGLDLGERMAHALQSALGRADSAIVIGADCPAMTREDLYEACELLKSGVELVIGPAEDSGYYLLGLQEVATELFKDMPWGSRKVLQETRQRAQGLGLSVRDLSTRWDVDRPEDVTRLNRSGLLSGNAL